MTRNEEKFTLDQDLLYVSGWAYLPNFMTRNSHGCAMYYVYPSFENKIYRLDHVRVVWCSSSVLGLPDFATVLSRGEQMKFNMAEAWPTFNYTVHLASHHSIA